MNLAHLSLNTALNTPTVSLATGFLSKEGPKERKGKEGKGKRWIFHRCGTLAVAIRERNADDGLAVSFPSGAVW